MSTFFLEILTPDREFFRGEAESLIVPFLDGDYGVEAGHEPVVSVLEPGTLHYKVEGQWHIASITTGIAQIMSEYTTLLVSAAEHPEEIDLNRAKAALERAEARLQKRENDQAFHSAQAALSRAMARMKTSNRYLK